jgi:cytochrome P450
MHRPPPEPAITSLFQRDPAVLADPYPMYHELRQAGPILRLAGPPDGPPWLNAWHILDWASAAACLRDPRVSSQRQMAAMPLERFGIDPITPAARFFWQMQAQTMLTLDAPDHTRLRSLSLKAFTPRVVEEIRGDVRAIVDGLLDDVAWRGESSFDLMADLAGPLPTMVIARLLGIPADDWAQFKRWSDGLIGFNITQEKIDRFFELGAYLSACIAERRRDPRDDLISGLIAARDRDDALSEDELIGQCIILLVGGHETTTFALGNAVYRLLAEPSLWAGLPDTEIAPAIEELLRYDSPFQALSRRATAKLEVHAAEIDVGDTIWVWIAAANRDPATFPDPDTILLARTDNRHLSFGLGPHYCLWAALARLELQVAVSALRDRWPTLRLQDAAVAWKRDGAIRGPAQLPVALR